MTADIPPLQDGVPFAEPTGIKEMPVFNRVVFGHLPSDVDADIMTTLCLARSLGMTKNGTPIETANMPSDADLTDPNVMVIEGIPKSYIKNGQTNPRVTGNFDNGPNDEPAAFMLYQSYSRELQNLPPQTRNKLKVFMGAFKAIEQGKSYELSEGIRKEDISSWSTVLAAIKLDAGRDMQKLATRSYEAFQVATQLKPFQDPLTKIYQRELEMLDTHNNHNLEVLRLKFQEEPNRLKNVTTLQGLKLAIADIRGLNIDKGVMRVVEEQLSPDLMLLVDDEFNPEGSVSGNRYLIKWMKKDGNQIDLADLADRLTMDETLFGSGFEVTSKTRFDGHPGIIGSPRPGSNLESEQVWHALQVYYDKPHYNQMNWGNEISGFIQDTGISTLMPGELSVVRPDLLPERSLIIALNDSEGYARIIKISESDYPFYKQIIDMYKSQTDGKEKIRKLLLEKTDVTEPEEISEIREKYVINGINHYLEENDAERVLDMIDAINEKTIGNFDGQTLRKILETVANSNTAIRHLIDPDDLTYRLDMLDLPLWMKTELSAQKNARFSMRAVQYKFHQVLLPKIIDEIGNRSDLSEIIATQLFRITDSQVYQETRNMNNPDSILDSIVRIATSPGIKDAPAIRGKILGLLRSKSELFASSWATIARRSPSLFIQAEKIMPELSEIRKSLNLDMQEIDGLMNATISVQSSDKVLNILDQQKVRGEKQAINVLISIGRPVTEVLEKQGADLDTGEHLMFTTDGWGIKINAEGNYLNNIKHDCPVIAKALCEQLRNYTGKIPENIPIRIIRGGFPNPLVHAVINRITHDPQIPDEMKKRIVFMDYNQGTKKYYETPYLFGAEDLAQ